MDAFRLTAPCGLDCFNCAFYLAKENPEARKQVEQWSTQFNVPIEYMKCDGCRDEDGRIPLQIHLYGDTHRCAAYECSKEKGIGFCHECGSFPCDNLHPYADRAEHLPHNIKVFNLCLIKKMGLEKWAHEKAASVRDTYFHTAWSLSRKGDDR